MSTSDSSSSTLVDARLRADVLLWILLRLRFGFGVSARVTYLVSFEGKSE